MNDCDMLSSPFAFQPANPVSILFVDPGADSFLPGLRRHFEVTPVTSEAQALRALKAFEPTLVITELVLPDGDGVAVCRQSKAGEAGATLVLATTSEPARVPEALKAGCDGVLMKPFPPNLLYTRVGRILRTREKALNDRAMWQHARSTFQIERAPHLTAGTNVVCQDAVCPSCGRRGAVGFDAAIRRRMWYACLPCGHVWMAPHHDDLKGRSPAAPLDQQRLRA
jgi:CheY-like chemotaxis protein